MAAIGGPKTVSDGLVLYIDPTNRKSYAGEPTTNLLYYSTRLDSGSWAGYCGNTTNVTYNTTDVLAPDGTFTATRIIRNDVSTCGSSSCWGLYWNNSNVVASGSVYATSIYARTKSGTVSLSHGISDGNTGATTISPEWKRLVYVATASSTSRGFQALTTTQNVTYYLWGAQTENKNYPTDYVESTSVRGTRSTLIYDVSQNGKSGSLSNGAGTGGTASMGIYLDGVNDVIWMGTGNTVFPLYSFTVEVAYRCFGTVPVTGTAPGVYTLTYGVRLRPGNPNLSCAVHDGVNSAINVATTDGINYRDGRWWVVTMTCSPTRVELFVNGVYKGGANGNWNGTTIWATNQFNIGRDNNDSMYFMWGEIGHYKLYDRVLSRDEISGNFNSTRSKYGL